MIKLTDEQYVKIVDMVVKDVVDIVIKYEPKGMIQSLLNNDNLASFSLMVDVMFDKDRIRKLLEL